MTYLPPLNVHSLLKKFDLHPSRGLGQNFLIDESALLMIVNSAGIQPDDAVLEIGPGLGSLTRHISIASGSVTAVELDSRLFPALSMILEGYQNVLLVQGDILDLDPASLINKPDYKVVANIPYNITSAVYRHLLEASVRPRRIVFTIQQEVASRICALPGDLSILALSIQVYGRPQLLATIPAEAFYPSPKVDSAVLRVDVYSEPAISSPLLGVFFRLVKAGFSQKRKNLRNSLSAGLHMLPVDVEKQLAVLGIDPRRRAETLSLEEWGLLSQQFSNLSE